MSFTVSGIGQIDPVSKLQLRQGKPMTTEENEQAGLMRRKLPSASLYHCFHTVTLDFLWFEANHNRWFDLMWSTSLALCAALHAVCCVYLPLLHFHAFTVWIQCMAVQKLKCPHSFANISVYSHYSHSVWFQRSFFKASSLLTLWCLSLDELVTVFLCHWGMGHSWMSMRIACHSTFWLMKVSLQCNFLMNVHMTL